MSGMTGPGHGDLTGRGAGANPGGDGSDTGSHRAELAGASPGES